MKHCEAIQDRLTDFLEGKLAGSDRLTVQTHLATCSGCAEMLDLIRLEPAAGPAPDLAGAILEATSGSPCERAREILGDHVDRTLARLDEQLIEGHMARCGECTTLAAALTRLARDLPAMALLDPGVGFVRDVMAATAARPSVWSALAARYRGAVARLLDRPRLAWETGYVGAMSLWLVWGAFGSPVSASPIPDAGRQAAFVREVRVQIGDYGQQAWSFASRRSLDTLDGLQSDVVERTGPTREMLAGAITEIRSGTPLEKIKRQAISVWKRFAPGDDASDHTEDNRTDAEESADPSKE